MRVAEEEALFRENKKYVLKRKYMPRTGNEFSAKKKQLYLRKEKLLLNCYMYLKMKSEVNENESVKILSGKKNVFNIVPNNNIF